MKRCAPTPLRGPQKKKQVRYNTSVGDDDIDRQIDEDLYLEITINATEVILPTNIKKYYGQVSRPSDGDTKWRSRFQKNYKYPGRFHNSEQEAIDYVKEVNIQQGWPIRNIIYRYGDEYYCSLTRGQITLFSVEHIEIIQNYNWCASYHPKNKSYYASARNSQKKNVYYHQMIFPDLSKDKSVDHINKISLDNRTENMRIACMRTQILNRGIMVTNTSGVTGVTIYSDKYCVAHWIDEAHISRRRFFSIKIHGQEKAFQMAVAQRKYIEETLPHYVLALTNTNTVL